MKCPYCGEEVANNSAYCESCGKRITKSKSKIWFLISSAFALILFFAITLFVQKSKAVSFNDLHDMNIKGKVFRIVEKSYYTINDECNDEQIEGGLFDGACFLSAVYADEHIGRLFFKKWFLSQVSDFEVQFDKFGNIILLKSLWEDGGTLYYNYDTEHKLTEMDSRDPHENQSEGIIKYNYLFNSNHLVEEYINHEDGGYSEKYTVKYQYDSHNNLSRAIMSNKYNEFIFSYSNGQLIDVYLKDYWGEGIPASHQIEYNSNGDIIKVTATGKRGRSNTARVTAFEYKYDSHKNWVERVGEVTFANGEVVKIRSTREYDYR